MRATHNKAEAGVKEVRDDGGEKGSVRKRKGGSYKEAVWRETLRKRERERGGVRDTAVRRQSK